MRVTFVGTGSAFSRRFGHCNLLVEAGDVRLMVDFGYWAPSRIEELGRKLGEITHLAITHLHADHVGGLEELGFVARFSLGHRPTLLLPPGLAEPLWEHTLRGTMEWISDPRGEPERCTLATFFRAVELTGRWHEVGGGLRLRPFRTDHVPGKLSYGYLLGCEGCEDRLVFVSDTRRRLPALEAAPSSGDFAVGPILHDCQLFDAGPSGVHTTLEDLLRYPEAIRRRIVITHYGDSIEKHVAAVEAAGMRLAWPGDVLELPGWERSLASRRSATPLRSPAR